LQFPLQGKYDKKSPCEWAILTTKEACTTTIHTYILEWFSFCSCASYTLFSFKHKLPDTIKWTKWKLYPVFFCLGCFFNNDTSMHMCFFPFFSSFRVPTSGYLMFYVTLLNSSIKYLPFSSFKQIDHGMWKISATLCNNVIEIILCLTQPQKLIFTLYSTISLTTWFRTQVY